MNFFGSEFLQMNSNWTIWTKSYLENRTTWRAHSSIKMFAIDSFDNPEEELFLTCTVVTQFEKPYLPFLPILAKCDFLVNNGPRTMLKHLWNVFK